MEPEYRRNVQGDEEFQTSDEEDCDEETRFFMKWEKFLKKRGLKITKDDRGKEQQGEPTPGTSGNSNEIYEKIQHPEIVEQQTRNNEVENSDSVTTIYKPAVEKESSKRFSSSSDDGDKLVSSDDSAMVDELINCYIGSQRVNKTTDKKERHDRRSSRRDSPKGRIQGHDNTSSGEEITEAEQYKRDRECELEQKAGQLVRNAE